MKQPWFRFFSSDWLGSPSVQMMSAAERGIYIQLLAASWEMGALPTEPKLLARLASVSLREFAKCWPAIKSCFSTAENGLLNSRLENERLRASTVSDVSRENARKSWKSRNRDDAGAYAGADAPAYANGHAKRMHRARVPDPVPDPVSEKDPEKDRTAVAAPPQLSLTHPEPGRHHAKAKRSANPLPYTPQQMAEALTQGAGARVALGELENGVKIRVQQIIRLHPSLDDVRAAARAIRASTFPPEPVGWGWLAKGNNFADAVARGKSGVSAVSKPTARGQAEVGGRVVPSFAETSAYLKANTWPREQRSDGKDKKP